MFRLCFLLTTITVSLLFSDFCFNYVMRIKGIYWPDRPLDIIKNVLLPKERQVETNKFILILSPETTHPWVCGGRAFFLQENKKYLILLLSPEKFVILNMREHKLMKSAERRDTDASKRTGRDDIHKSKTVS